MTQHFSFIAHAQTGPADLTAFAVIAVAVAATAVWMVSINRRLDAAEDPMTDRNTTGAPTSSRWGSIVLVAALVLLVGVGFAIYSAQTNLASGQAQAVVDDLCRAAEQATTDPDAALATFNARPHDALHGLDTDLRREDPREAQRLAAAKAAAEGALLSRSPGGAALTLALAEQTAAAYRSLDPETPLTACS